MILWFLMISKGDDLELQPPEVFYKKRYIFFFFAIVTGKHQCWSLILIKLQALRPVNLLKRISTTGFFL